MVILRGFFSFEGFIYLYGMDIPVHHFHLIPSVTSSMVSPDAAGVEHDTRGDSARSKTGVTQKRFIPH
jgi:hypothetical protein